MRYSIWDLYVRFAWWLKCDLNHIAVSESLERHNVALLLLEVHHDFFAIWSIPNPSQSLRRLLVNFPFATLFLVFGRMGIFHKPYIFCIQVAPERLNCRHDQEKLPAIEFPSTLCWSVNYHNKEHWWSIFFLMHLPWVGFILCRRLLRCFRKCTTCSQLNWHKWVSKSDGLSIGDLRCSGSFQQLLFIKYNI